MRETAALLWRDFALFGAAAEDVALVEVLHDYGLTVDWHVAGTPASEALWEADAARAEHDAVAVAPTRALGVVTVNAHAYEDFLQTADASMADLAADPARADAGAAWHASGAAYRVGRPRARSGSATRHCWPIRSASHGAVPPTACRSRTAASTRTATRPTCCARRC